jgi:hypothetical protein
MASLGDDHYRVSSFRTSACEYAVPTILRCSVGDGARLPGPLLLLLSLLLVDEPVRQKGDDVL